jgi:hypothetical protein
MHFLSGYTSQRPWGRVPPHGPFLSLFGQRCEQMKAVWLRMHSPHRWHPKMGTLTASSARSIRLESRLSPGESGFPLVEMDSRVFSVMNKLTLIFINIYWLRINSKGKFLCLKFIKNVKIVLDILSFFCIFNSSFSENKLLI